jgi:opacity protein-like surface antigen
MKKFITMIGFAACTMAGFAQDSLETVEVVKPKYARATFNATKLINMQTTEVVSKGTLQFLISHHFSYLWNKDQNGGQNFAQVLGLNSGSANTYLSFDYSITDNINVGGALAGRSRFEGFAKWRFLRQQTGLKNVPVSVAWYLAVQANAASTSPKIPAENKIAFLNQLLIARKFSDKLSIELIPTWIHYNVVPYGINNSNEVFNIGVGAKYKVSSGLNVTMEYNRQLNMYENIISGNGTILNYSPDLLSAGIEINTGGHLFQFYVGNTIYANNIEQLSKNDAYIKDGKFAFGFTINRSLSLKKDK